MRDLIGKFIKGHKKIGGFVKGDKHTDESKRKVSESQIGRFGKRNKKLYGELDVFRQDYYSKSDKCGALVPWWMKAYWDDKESFWYDLNKKKVIEE
ncbi:MAG: hypothetical protein GON13_02125 [Nanoarchaeota archaeon]|nr:hypothetical protein [Nanoarchaeota archaeon]